jgi:hypothetical protein
MKVWYFKKMFRDKLPVTRGYLDKTLERRFDKFKFEFKQEFREELSNLFYRFLNPLYESQKKIIERLDTIEGIQLKAELQWNENIKRLDD